MSRNTWSVLFAKQMQYQKLDDGSSRQKLNKNDPNTR